ncbi:MAG: hypothetical protein KC493_06385 [Bacteriovoracaceae bacterium]|nr:hypothetical protein [Bacteriovoracaceae bacterium]
MKLFFNIFFLVNSVFARDLFIVSGPKSQELKINSVITFMNKRETFTKGYTVKRLTNKCIPDKDSLLHLCISKRGDTDVAYSNTKILNQIFKELNKTSEISK